MNLDVQIMGTGGYECNPNEFSRYVDGVYDIKITLRPDEQQAGAPEYTGLSDWTWPDGLGIQVSKLSRADDEFEPSPGLQDRLKLHYYVKRTQVVRDSLWRYTGKLPPHSLSAPEYYFAFQVPAELADSYLCFNAEWNHPQYGYLVCQKPICSRIVMPCSDATQHQVWTTHVWNAEEEMQYEQAILLADSFMAMGWHELHGLIWATLAAQKLEWYDDALRFIDMNFNMNHRVSIIPEAAPLEAPTEESRRDYEQQRGRLVELKNQQQER